MKAEKTKLNRRAGLARAAGVLGLALAASLAACGGGSSAADEEEGLGRRPDTLTGAYTGRIAVVENSCSDIAADKTVPVNLEVTQTGSTVAGTEGGMSYKGTALAESFGFQIVSSGPTAGEVTQYTMVYSGEGSKFNATLIFNNKNDGCAAKFSGTVVYWG